MDANPEEGLVIRLSNFCIGPEWTAKLCLLVSTFIPERSLTAVLVLKFHLTLSAHGHRWSELFPLTLTDLIVLIKLAVLSLTLWMRTLPFIIRYLLQWVMGTPLFLG
ncbi:hypothetical protein NA56DRAFT_645795 [Hyaloscypha hepaticicola]|uniref:Uncharacterized protein n=1 Tax=Hyaloscypha hepaticicola TaxID=2082293 RepID=A0A2J6Q484_9HELO|nr:hypothetical protein NA56DRAFT_645795 [Hyaloscypha hepaticicola]